MVDVFSKKKRSEVMSRIKGQDTKFEVKIRSWLFKAGYRFRKNDKRFPGKPDIVLPKYNTAIFVNGCFWHNHKSCKYAYIPKTRTKFWVDKFTTNKNNDLKNHKALKELGWSVLVVWECQLKKNFDDKISYIFKYLAKKK